MLQSDVRGWGTPANKILQAEVAELADAHDSKSCGETHEGSTPSFGTKTKYIKGLNEE